jgi:hypothetical protein
MAEITLTVEFVPVSAPFGMNNIPKLIHGRSNLLF